MVAKNMGSGARWLVFEWRSPFNCLAQDKILKLPTLWHYIIIDVHKDDVNRQAKFKICSMPSVEEGRKMYNTC